MGGTTSPRARRSAHGVQPVILCGPTVSHGLTPVSQDSQKLPFLSSSAAVSQVPPPRRGRGLHRPWPRWRPLATVGLPLTDEEGTAVMAAVTSHLPACVLISLT